MVSADVSLEVVVRSRVGAVGTPLAVLSLAFVLLLKKILGKFLTIIIVGITSLTFLQP